MICRPIQVTLKTAGLIKHMGYLFGKEGRIREGKSAGYIAANTATNIVKYCGFFIGGPQC
jgi:hypothetical protein